MQIIIFFAKERRFLIDKCEQTIKTDFYIYEAKMKTHAKEVCATHDLNIALSEFWNSFCLEPSKSRAGHLGRAKNKRG